MKRLNWIKLGALSLLWGASFIFVEAALRDFGPLTLVLVRVAIAALVLWMVVWRKGEAIPNHRREWLAYALMGVLANVLPFGLISWGQQSITAGMASILNATVPLFTLLLGVALGSGERLGGRKWLGVVVGLMGVACLVEWGDEGAGEARLSQLAVLAAALCYAVGAVYGKRFRRTPVVNAASMLSCSAVILAPLALWMERPFEGAMPTGVSWAALVALAVLSTAAAYVLYFGILSGAGATYLSLVTYLIPVVSVSLGCVFLGELIGYREIGAMTVIFGGLALVDPSMARRVWMEALRVIWVPRFRGRRHEILRITKSRE